MRRKLLLLAIHLYIIYRDILYIQLLVTTPSLDERCHSSRHLHWMNVVDFSGLEFSLGLRSTNNRHKSFDLSLWLVISRGNINLLECSEHWVYTSYEGISGTVLKDKSLILVGRHLFRLPLSPRRARSVLFSRVNRSLVRRWLITWEYSSFVFFETSWATFLWNRVHSGAIPPVVEKTKGVNVAFSTWMMRWL